MNLSDRERWRSLALSTIGARHVGARVYADALKIMRDQITPEVLLALLDDATHTAESIEDQIRALALPPLKWSDCEIAINAAGDIALDVAREKGSAR